MTRAAIIGGGIIGCAVAFELARRGFQATVIDGQGEVGHGSTSASCGIVRRFYSTAAMTAMAHEGAATWAAWREHLGVEDEAGMARFERPGMLFIPPAVDKAVLAVVAHMRALGVRVDVLSRQELAQRFPYFDVKSHSPVRRPQDPDFFEETGRLLDAAVFEPDAGYVVSPLLAAHNLRVAGEKAGVAFRLGRKVVAIRRGNARAGRFSLDLEGGAAIDADLLVNAAGPHSGAVNRLAGVALPIEIRPLRREVHAVENPTFGRIGAAFPVVGDIDSGVYFRPEGGGRDVIVGSLEPACDTPEWVDDADHFAASATAAGYERQVLRLMKRFPEVRLGKRRGIAALYDVTLADWNPVLDRTDLPGFYVAIGTSGSSFKTAPVIGLLMAELISACERGRDLDDEPLRLRLPRTGNEVDAGFFSRLRTGHKTSGTVLG